MPMRPRLFGSPRVRSSACFHAARKDWLIDRSRCVRIRFGSVLHRTNSSSEFLRFSRSRHPFGGQQLPAWVSALLSTSLCRVRFLRRNHPPPASSPAISTVRRLPRQGLRACFIPQPSSGLFLVQGFVHFVQHQVFIRPVPSLPFSSRSLTCKQAAVNEGLDFDVLLHTKPLCLRFGN